MYLRQTFNEIKYKYYESNRINNIKNKNKMKIQRIRLNDDVEKKNTDKK